MSLNSRNNQLERAQKYVAAPHGQGKANQAKQRNEAKKAKSEKVRKDKRKKNTWNNKIDEVDQETVVPLQLELMLFQPQS